MADSKPGVHVLQLKHVCVSQSMVSGEKFIKWDEDSSLVTPVTLRVDSYGYFLYWTDQNEETQVLDMCTIRDTRNGHYAKVPKEQKMRDQVTMGASQDSLEDKTLTVAYGPDFVNVSFLNFVTSKKDMAKQWTDEILKMANNLLALNGSVHYFLRKAYVRLTLQADKGGKIAVKSIVRTFAQHKDDRRRVEKAFIDSTGLPSGKDESILLSQFTFDDFYDFYKKLTGRQEVERVFEELFGNKKLVTVEQFVEFLNSYQRDPRLNEILYPYANPDRAKDIFNQYEPCESNIAKGCMSPEGFLRFLLSEDNSIVSADKFDLSHDMEQPLCHYFINSSHNTYLTGHQFTGKSSVEIYRETLLGGCRCVELDFWNGKNEDPIIYHGYTLVPEVPAKEVIEAIAESAFKTSEYPVVLSFENHCNPKQQAKIAQYCREYFGEMMLDNPLESHGLEPGVPLPSPAQLKRKIIIKNKKKHQHHRVTRDADKGLTAGASALAVTIGSVSGTAAQGNGDIPRPRLEKEESKDSVTEDEDGLIAAAEELELGSESDDEEESSTLSNLSPEEIRQREKAQKDKGTAGKETEAGAEISALVNYVQPVHFHSFEHAERRNRSYEMSSFVETQSTALLKEHPIEFVNYNKRQMSRVYPRGTRVDSSNFMPHVFWNAGCQLVALNYQTLDLAMQLNLGIFELNGRTGYLLKPQFMRRMDRKFDPFAESTVDGIIAGTVSVQVISGQFISDKRVSTYVEVDMFGLPADTVRKRFRTKTVLNNGLNPIYDQEGFVFNKVVLPDLACLRIAVYEESGRLLGHRVLPVTGLCPGYRHLSLRSDAGQPLNLSTLFVNIMVKDYVPDGLSDFANALANPIKYQSELEKRSKQLSILTGEMEDPSDVILGSEAVEEKELNEKEVKMRENVQTSVDKDVSSVFYVPEPTPNRQDSTKQKHAVIQREQGGAEESPGLPSSPKAVDIELELVVVAESFDKLMEHKSIKKQRDKLNKKLDDLQKDFDKSQFKIEEELGIVTKAKVPRTSNRLIKRISSKNMNKESVIVRSTSESTDILLAQRLLPVSQKFNDDKANLRKHYHEIIYTTLEKCIATSRDKQLKLLKEQHDSQVGGATKSIHAQVSREFKSLNKRHKDKDELDRMKREKREEIVRKGVVEHERLSQQFEKKEKELKRQYEELLKRFEEERTREWLKITRDQGRPVSAVLDEGIASESVSLGGQLCKPHS